MPTLVHESILPTTPRKLFGLHARPEALRRLSPSFPPVRSVEQDGPFVAGTSVRIRIGVGPLTASWKALLEQVDPGRRFVDVQVSGPFRSWRHVHEFRPVSGGGCVMRDEVRWESRGPLSWLDRMLIRPFLAHYFRKRHAALAAWVNEIEQKTTPESVTGRNKEN